MRRDLRVNDSKARVSINIQVLKKMIEYEHELLKNTYFFGKEWNY